MYIEDKYFIKLCFENSEPQVFPGSMKPMLWLQEVYVSFWEREEMASPLFQLIRFQTLESSWYLFLSGPCPDSHES